MLDPAHKKRFLAAEVKRYVVALSGGADSVALLHNVVSLGLPNPVVVIHVNHGLQEEADEWQAFCEKLCKSLGVTLTCVQVEVDKKGSIEEGARIARYEAFENFLEAGDLLLLAHHANDQIETIMFNLLRGSNAFGVRGMPVERAIGRAEMYRPLLDIDRKEVLAYCQTHDLSWVEDLSNQDESLDRNYLRHSILPGLESRFPAINKALLNALDRDAEAAGLMADYSQADLQAALSVDGGIQLDIVREYSELRAVNLLRQWLIQKGIQFPTGRQLREYARAMVAAREDTIPSLKWSSFEMVRHNGCVYLLHTLPQMKEVNVALQERIPVEFGGGLLTMERVSGKGILAEENLELRTRIGGETMQLQQTRTLKNIFQERDVPTWLRPRLPLVFENGELLALPGIPSWDVEGVYAENRKPGLKQSGWVFTFDIQDKV